MERGWRLITTAPLDGAANMAIDQALFEGLAAGGRPALRFYRWDPPCLSLGRNQPAADRVRRGVAAERGIDIVRRPTGGSAVLHDDELTYSVALPARAFGSARETYATINRALVTGLRRLGVRAGLAAAAGPAARRPRPSAASATAVCFRAPVGGEVVCGGRKLIGSAQRYERRTLLQHGSLLLGGGQAAVADLITGEPHDAADGAVGLEEILGGRRPEWVELTTALAAGFEEALGIRLAPAQVDPHAASIRRLAERFRADGWTWRR